VTGTTEDDAACCCVRKGLSGGGYLVNVELIKAGDRHGVEGYGCRSRRVQMFNLDDLIGSCTAALSEANPRRAIQEILIEVVSDPSSVEEALPPRRAELVPLYSSPELTIVNVVWAPAMILPPHDHRMWALIGVYGGKEDNSFFRRTPTGIVPSGGKQLVTSDVTLLGHETIHSVSNPLSHEYTGAIHIYGGDFMNEPRSMWDTETMEERPADGESVQRLFEAANTGIAPS
jgi:predicted metal-dependent enzyme (double-stranded beta helix superfamily)